MQLSKFKSHPHGVLGVWHLLYSHYEKWVQKSQKPYGIWDFCCGIYLGCTIWLRRRDLNLELNHGKAVYGIRNLLRYGINAKHCMESSRRKIHLR